MATPCISGTAGSAFADILWARQIQELLCTSYPIDLETIDVRGIAPPTTKKARKHRMKVRELIRELQKLDPESRVFVQEYNGAKNYLRLVRVVEDFVTDETSNLSPIDARAIRGASMVRISAFEDLS